jgi:hypothetical protein
LASIRAGLVIGMSLQDGVGRFIETDHGYHLFLKARRPAIPRDPPILSPAPSGSRFYEVGSPGH